MIDGGTGSNGILNLGNAAPDGNGYASLHVGNNCGAKNTSTIASNGGGAGNGDNSISLYLEQL